MTAINPVETLAELSRKSLDHVSSLGELNLRTWESIAARQTEALNFAAKHGIRVTKLLSESKDYNDIVKGQVQAFNEWSQSLSSEAKANFQLVGKLTEEYRAWLEKSVAAANEGLRQSAAVA